MTERWAGWLEAHELPVSGHLRSVAEILSAPESPEERRAMRREEAEAEAARADLRDAADSAAAAAFRARVNGTPPRDVLAEAAAEPFRDREAAARRRAAIDVLRRHGLDDVITGGQSGVIIDVNLGVLEPEPDLAQRAAMDRAYESARSEREVAERVRAVDLYRQRLDARFRAVGLDQHTSSRSASATERPVSYR